MLCKCLPKSNGLLGAPAALPPEEEATLSELSLRDFSFPERPRNVPNSPFPFFFPPFSVRSRRESIQLEGAEEEEEEEEEVVGGAALCWRVS